jgi:ABC-2 type transport system ATP-binding protein
MIRLESVRRTFGSLVAVDDVSLSIEPGEVFGLLGPNGAGKTTTIRLLVGLPHPDAGRVLLGDGDSPETPRVRARLGVAPQSLALNDELTGLENLRFFASLYGLRGKPRRRRIDELLARTGLTEKAGKRVKTFSGGMKRATVFRRLQLES